MPNTPTNNISIQNPAIWPAETVPKAFSQTVGKFGSRIAIRQIVPIEGAAEKAPYAERFKEIAFTWNDYYQASSDFAKSLIALGVDPRRGVTIQGSNSPQWLFTNMGTLMAGGLSAGVYPTNGPELSQHAVKNSNAAVVVVEDEKQLLKYAGFRSTAVKCYVVWNKVNPEICQQLKAPVYSWNEFLSLGQSIPSSELSKRIDQQNPDDVCSLIYTSGTTDLPKAAALTHDNLVWTAKNAGSAFNLNENDVGISYLPLSHIAAQMVDSIVPAMAGYSINIAPPDALKGSNLKHHLVHTNPTYFLAVPRVWEKFMEAMHQSAKQLTGLKKVMSNTRRWLVSDLKKCEANPRSDLMSGINKVRHATDQFFLSRINHKILGALGLQRCTLAASGAGALDPKVASYFKDFGIKIIDLYGLSETSGPTTFALTDVPSGSSGRAVPGTQLKISNTDEEGKGEICVKGRHVFKGYWRNLEATKNAFDKDGFFLTGDEGRVDDKGNLFITGRLKELIKTSGGENIPPVRIEQRIKQELPIIDQVVVIGDKRHYLSCLVTLQTELDPDGNPTNTLAPIVIDQLSKIGSSAATMKEAQNDPAVQEFLMKGIKKANALADSQAQYVQKMTILPESLSIANGMITPTQKLKRSVIEKNFAPLVQSMYP